MRLNDLLNTLPKLSHTDLELVLLRTKAAMSLNGKAADCPPVDYLFEGICVELNRRGLLADTRLPKRMATPAFTASSQAGRNYLEGYLPVLNHADKGALGQLAARPLAAYLHKRQRPVSAASLMFAVDDIPAAIDEAYPSYLAAGLLPACWK